MSFLGSLVYCQSSRSSNAKRCSLFLAVLFFGHEFARVWWGLSTEPIVVGGPALIASKAQGKCVQGCIADIGTYSEKSGGSPLSGKTSDHKLTVLKATTRRNLRHVCDAGEVGQADFEQAILRAVAGVEKRSVLQGAEKESVARHECGHALVSTAVATIIPTSPQVS